ncbi:Vacuolar protein sorting-associated protein 68 [Erysiphe neolycopersici]|uniref:Vacuolar protein sorting-associated protein 68 n=1 Tax=Erysiphe neolycopersici TaxID=212602 RepID=A0A420HXF5_9PEZI|nr:Vacuolar protein sorting-associated protein 68 [Erysiphe neolycopersici]
MPLPEQRLWRFTKPDWVNSATTRSLGVYGAGAMFSLAFYLILDVAVWSHSHKNGSIIHVNFTDWVPFIFSSLGMLIINSIEKTRLSANSFSYSGSGVAWKARVVLFLGFASLAGGMAGGIAILILKYVMSEAVWPTLYMGVANVLSNTSVMLSSIILWVCQNMEDEYSYNLAL